MSKDVSINTSIHHIFTYAEAGNMLDAEDSRGKEKQMKYLSHGASLQVSDPDSHRYKIAIMTNISKGRYT